MRKKSLALTLMLAFSCLLGGGDLMGQTTITIGTGTSTTVNSPINTRTAYSLSETIYLQSEINQSSKPITKIAYYYNRTTAIDYSVDIYMQNTEKTSFSASNDYVTVSAETDLVYRGTVSFPNKAGWVTITLDSPFEYNSNYNLLVIVDNNQGTGDGSWSNYPFRYTSTSANTCWYANGTKNYDPTSSQDGSAPGSMRPNIQITFDDGDSCMTPTDLSSVPTSTTAEVTWTAGNNETAWELYYSDDPDDDPEDATAQEIQTINTSPEYTITSLTPNTEYFVYVRAKCSDSEYSDWTIAESFTTLCAAENIPYSYDFEDADELNCWTMRDTEARTGISTESSKSGTHSFKFYNLVNYNSQYLISPELSGTNYGVCIEFYHEQTTAGSTLQIGYSSTNNAIDAFNWISSTENKAFTNFTLFKTYCPAGTKFIAIKYDSGQSIYIDDISFIVPNTFSTVGNWNIDGCWSYGALPTASDNVIINAACTIPDEYIASANNITIGSGSLTIADGGQLILPTTSTGVQATVKKETYGATTKDTKTDYYWYAISSAVANPSISSATNIASGTYDLYRYNEEKNAELPWENYKNTAYSSTFTTLKPGRGYLYRNASNLSIEMTGEINVEDFNYAVTKTGSGVLAGFNLIGNPYSHDIYKGDGTAIPNGSGLLRTGFYYMEPTTGKWTAGTDNSTAIKPNQGVLVQTDANGSIEMTNTNSNGSSKSNNDNIMFKVANSQYSDEAYAWFDKGRGLNKISHRNAEVPMLYINQDGENYAIATMSDDIKTFSLNFKAMTMGKYTLSYKTKGEFNYLHVIDRFTGEDVDMLLEGEYSFVASPNDSDARFIVRLEYTSNNGTNDSSVFAYQSGNEIIVSGEGELQIFDVMGRKISTHQINGVETVNVNAHGVYIFKLNEKTQKIIIK